MLLILIVDLVMLAVTLQVSGVCSYAGRLSPRLMNFSGWEILTLTLPDLGTRVSITQRMDFSGWEILTLTLPD